MTVTQLAIRPSIRVTVSSRTPAIRAGLRELLAAAGFEVADSVTPDELLEDQIDVDVLVVELGDDRELRQALGSDLGGVPAVVLTDRAGASASELAPRAWLAPDASEEALAAAVSAVAAGLSVYGAALLPAAGEAFALGADVDGEVASITDREHDVLALLAAGLPNKAIARQLGISEHTVKFHVGSLLSKLEAQSRTEAVTIAARQGLLTL